MSTAQSKHLKKSSSKTPRLFSESNHSAHLTDYHSDSDYADANEVHVSAVSSIDSNVSPVLLGLRESHSSHGIDEGSSLISARQQMRDSDHGSRMSSSGQYQSSRSVQGDVGLSRDSATGAKLNHKSSTGRSLYMTSDNYYLNQDSQLFDSQDSRIDVDVDVSNGHFASLDDIDNLDGAQSISVDQFHNFMMSLARSGDLRARLERRYGKRDRQPGPEDSVSDISSDSMYGYIELDDLAGQGSPGAQSATRLSPVSNQPVSLKSVVSSSTVPVSQQQLLSTATASPVQNVSVSASQPQQQLEDSRSLCRQERSNGGHARFAMSTANSGRHQSVSTTRDLICQKPIMVSQLPVNRQLVSQPVPQSDVHLSRQGALQIQTTQSIDNNSESTMMSVMLAAIQRLESQVSTLQAHQQPVSTSQTSTLKGILKSSSPPVVQKSTRLKSVVSVPQSSQYSGSVSHKRSMDGTFDEYGHNVPVGTSPFKKHRSNNIDGDSLSCEDSDDCQERHHAKSRHKSRHSRSSSRNRHSDWSTSETSNEANNTDLDRPRRSSGRRNRSSHHSYTEDSSDTDAEHHLHRHHKQPSVRFDNLYTSKRNRVSPGQQLPVFRGDANSDLEVFLTQFEICAEGYGWTDSEKVSNLRLRLQGSAATMVRKHKHAPYKKFVAKLRELFGKDNQTGACETQLFSRIRQPGETIQELRVAIQQLAEWAYPGEKRSKMYVRTERDAFIRALNDQALCQEVWRQRPLNIAEAAEIANDFENQFCRHRQIPATDTAVNGPAIGAISHDNNKKQPKPWLSDIEHMMSTLKTEIQQSVANGQPPMAGLSKPVPTATQSTNQSLPLKSTVTGKHSGSQLPGVCRLCNQPGHYKLHCPLLTPEEKQKILQYKAQKQSSKAKFQLTSQPSVSFQLPADSSSETYRSHSVGTLFPVFEQPNDVTRQLFDISSVLYYCIVYIAGQPYRVLLDLGATITCIGSRLVPPGMHVQSLDMAVRAANKTLFRIDGTINLKFKVEPEGKEYSHLVLVTPDIDDIIFGNDLLRPWNFKCDLSDGSMYFDGVHMQMHPVQIGPTVRKIYAANDITVDSMHEVNVPVNMPMGHMQTTDIPADADIQPPSIHRH